ncbi:hypothetical protein VE02_00347 [Pseudogymnoascus sp. 03VT05]|nr:hypothetical protein VE02_00347 [Pseudogymnoascus sp. 03VT05]
MNTIQRKSKRPAQRHIQTQPTAPESPFLNLPLELIYLITSHLPTESVACLSLCSHHLYSSLKTEYHLKTDSSFRIDNLHPPRDADSMTMNTFLHLLERDLPLHIIYPHCNKLHYTPLASRHLVTERYSPTTSQTWTKCRTRDSLGQGIQYTPPHFTSTIFLMAMKAYRQGRDTTKLLRLLSHKQINEDPEGFVELHTSEARIRNDSLLVRDQMVFMLPASLTTPFSLPAEFGSCKHVFLSSMADLRFCGIYVPRAEEMDDHVNKEGIIYCRYCYMEMRIDFKSYGKAGNAMFVTRWMDIGEGRDVNDVKWKVRLGGGNEWLWDDVIYPRGSICSAFEGRSSDDFKFDSLITEQDEMELCARCPLAAPEDEDEKDEDEVEPAYMVTEGRLIMLPSTGTGGCCDRSHQL